MDHYELIYGQSAYTTALPISTTPSTISSKPQQAHSNQFSQNKPKQASNQLQQQQQSQSPSTVLASVNNEVSNKRKKKIMRKGAETQWEDPTLEDWPENDYRIFCGDLGNEVNDEVLSNAFKKYQSFVKSKVVRDRNTLKSKGYGFVSVMNQDDYIRIMREMQGKYIGNRPVKLKKSDWQEKSVYHQKSKFVKKK